MAKPSGDFSGTSTTSGLFMDKPSLMRPFCRVIFLALCLLCVGAAAFGQSSTVNGPSKDGEEVACDYPAAEWMPNIGSRLDGAGMCVFTSVEMSARWQGLEQMRGFRDWCATNYRGGGYPSKLANLIGAWCKHKGIPVPAYVQYEGRSPEAFLDACSKTGRMSCITYGYSPRYRGTIYHMTNCPHYGQRYGVCMDNNAIGGNGRNALHEWMTKEELVKRIKHPGNSAWVFAWLAPAPPLPPRN